MNYFLCKLCFHGPVHFGSPNSAMSLETSEDHFRADTLFSALCHTALKAEGEKGIEQLCRWVQQGELLLSDSMPWESLDGEDRYYLPKPLAVSKKPAELPTHQRKAFRQLNWIPVEALSLFEDSIQSGKPYQLEQYPSTFGISVQRTQANTRLGEDTVPYQVGLFQFASDCGLYFLCACQTEEQEEELYQWITFLGGSGIGGKTSAGYGAFQIDDWILLNDPFDEQTKSFYERLTQRAEAYLLLSSSLPTANELDCALDGAAYQLVRRSGFVFSETYAQQPRKKQVQYFLTAGSVVRHSFQGELYSVGSKDAIHPVYRYGKPLLLGVNL